MLHFLITRPQGKGVALAQQLEQAGYRASLFPVLKIDYLTPDSQELSPLINADKIIFVSQDAVNALSALKPAINLKAQFYGVGQQTVDTIYAEFGIRAAVPKQHDSEGLLALKSLASVDGSNIVLVKGNGGRPDIAKTLKQRGAFLNNCVVYQRVAAADTPHNWIANWQSQKVDSIVITSNAAVDAIFNNLAAPQIQWLKQCRFYVASERIGAYLQQHQVSSANIHIAAGASDNAMFACINQQGSKMSEQSAVEKPTTETISTSSEEQSKTVPKKQPKAKQKVSKIAVIALIIALIIAFLMGYEFYQKFTTGKVKDLAVTELSQQNTLLQKQLQELKAAQTNLQQALVTSEQQTATALRESTSKNEQQLTAALQQMQQQGPSLNPEEVSSLQRMAEFKLWAEQDYQGASAVLKRLNGLLSEHPGTISVRQAIIEDIQTLANVKPIPIEAIYLQLGSVVKSIDNLVFNAVSLPETVVQIDDNVLSEDISDWQQNLKNSWQQFLDSFITIRHREDVAIEPLLSEQQRHLVSQRIKLYLTQAQDALLSKQASVYFAALSEAKGLVNEYFKADDEATKAVLKSLSDLEKEPLNFTPEVTLKSAQQIEEWAK